MSDLFKEINLISEDSQQKSRVERVANSLSLKLNVFQSVEEVIDGIENIKKKDALCLIDFDSLHEVDKVLETLKKFNINHEYISMVKGMSNETFSDLPEENFVKSIVSKKSPNFEEHLRNQISLVAKFSSTNQIFENESLIWQEFKITQSSQILKCEQSIEGFMDSLNFSSSTKMKMQTVTGELICNSVYNSKFFKDKSFEETRSKDWTLPPGDDIVFSFAYDGRRFLVKCEDSHGSLNFSTIFSKLNHVMAEKKVKKGAGLTESGGIGFFMLWNMLDELWISVEEGKKTLCLGILYPPEVNRKKRRVPAMQCFNFILN